MNQKISNKLAWGIILPFLLVVGLLILNKTAVQDWWHQARYTPSTQIQLLADAAEMSDEGERLFFRADPELISRAKTEALCLGPDNLGCLVDGPKIYLLEYEDNGSPEYFQSVVTAAHEMLHMVYYRLGDEEKSDVNQMIDNALANRVEDSRIFNTLNKTSTDQEYYDEAHSLLGTEIDFLPLSLEAHYQKYFDNRENVLDAFDKSKSLLQ
ncbi:MAG: hypothetical protein R3313_03840 [Candidatus Saccharimonadales bacterium]|nr:hypothetical protein [Candidatus Saccharimonadales bacterium]